MKKKIKDLTFEECKKICLKQKNCYCCPLYIDEDYMGRDICVKKRIDLLDEEIEVEDEH